ncbi:flagellar synthesis regulator FleN [Gracilibacillus boraciitolerans JCM 21714]|uniref:Flagellar synthesis regulator FleN n=1 Tax=Gracilibacillus boraciitolerans JCM 21714 TaxID=1298598 RepID=W4VEH7_9BACI|nr:hypothetical protein [Gracilibacillus boraciitolerans]GAE91607.1 flagellar synthesis regulator FleN [Gracilibacillus boraciitolerans JCM 21714]
MTDAYSMVKHILLQHPVDIHLIINRSRNEKQGIDTMNRMVLTVKRFLKHDIRPPLGTIPDDSAVVEAVIAQHPFILHKPKSKASVAMEQITKQFLGELSKKKINSGFLNRLKRLITER